MEGRTPEMGTLEGVMELLTEPSVALRPLQFHVPEHDPLPHLLALTLDSAGKRRKRRRGLRKGEDAQDVDGLALLARDRDGVGASEVDVLNRDAVGRDAGRGAVVVVCFLPDSVSDVVQSRREGRTLLDDNTVGGSAGDGVARVGYARNRGVSRFRNGLDLLESGKSRGKGKQ